MLIEKVISQGEVLTAEQLVKVTGGTGSGMGNNTNRQPGCSCSGGSGDNSNYAPDCSCSSDSSSEDRKQNLDPEKGQN